jgi:hypothetical protein
MDVARAFGRSVRTVRRHQARYVQGGMAALGREESYSVGSGSATMRLPVPRMRDRVLAEARKAVADFKPRQL